MEELSFSDQIRRPDFALKGPHLIEASAGTGKTYNIQNIYVRLIQETESRVSQIQVMTFTDAATAELRDRLRGILQGVKSYYDWQAKLIPDLPSFCKNEEERLASLVNCVPESDRELARMRVELALLEFDNASISTIHGFCAQILHRHAFEIGIPFQTEIQKDGNDELAQMQKNWWRSLPKGDPLKTLENWNLLQEYMKRLSSADHPVLWKQGDFPVKNGVQRDPVLDVAVSLLQVYEENRSNRQEFSFDDLLRSVRDALYSPGGEKLAQVLRQDFHALIVDEFQDTDPVQYGIIRKAFLESPEFPVYLVGDPKQAIYAFRGGDIYTYLSAVDALAARNLHPASLWHNFRSVPRLMDAVNQIFQDGSDGTHTFYHSQIAYRKSKVLQEPKNCKGDLLPKPFVVCELEGGKRADCVTETACQIEQVLNECKDGQPVYEPSDIAVLVNSHSLAGEIAEQLRRRGIPCVLQRNGNFFSSELFASLTVFLQAVLTPENLRVLRGALLTPFVGLPPEECQAETEDLSLLSNWVGKFLRWQKIWREKGIGEMLHCVAEENGVLDRLALQTEKAEELLMDFRQITEALQLEENGRYVSPEELLTWLQEQAVEKRPSSTDTSPELSRQKSMEGTAVRIMTMFASKGLQFPVVFLPDAWNVENSSDPRMRIHNKLASFHLADRTRVFAPEKTRCSGDEIRKHPSVRGNTAKDIGKGELVEEKTRLLYVAMTRAIERTYVITPALKGDTKLASSFKILMERAQSHAQDLENSTVEWRFCPLPDPENIEMWNRSGSAPARDEEWESCQKCHAFSSRRFRGSYSALSPGGIASETAEEAPEWERDMDQEDEPAIPLNIEEGAEIFSETSPAILQIPGGASIGSCWHEILEMLDFTSDPASEENRSQQKNILQKFGFRPDLKIGYSSETLLDATSHMLAQTLKAPLTAPDGTCFSLGEIPLADRMSEEEFSFSTVFSRHVSTVAIGDVLRKHWQNQPDKQLFLEAVNDWNREIPAGYMVGFMDLVFRKGEAFYIVDWKSNRRMGRMRDFEEEGIREEMAEHGYFFQYLLYSVVLHCYLKQLLGTEYCWERHYGGVRYYFLRGVACGIPSAVFADRPSEELLEDLAEVLGVGSAGGACNREK